jgi:hypothetical protein
MMVDNIMRIRVAKRRRLSSKSLTGTIPECGFPEALLSFSEIVQNYGVSIQTIDSYGENELLSPIGIGADQLCSADAPARLKLIPSTDEFVITGGEGGGSVDENSFADPLITPELSPKQLASRIMQLEFRHQEIVDAIAVLKTAQRRLTY